MKLAGRLWVEKGGKPYAEAGVDGTSIYEVVHMDEDLRRRVIALAESDPEEHRRQWKAELDRLGVIAERRVRARWRAFKKKRRRGRWPTRPRPAASPKEPPASAGEPR